MLALQVLYEVDLTDHDPEEAMARAFAEHEPVTPDVVEHVRSLVRGVGLHRAELDPVIAGAAPARDLAEQAAIERNVLRLAAYELLNVPSVPPKVAINEGVELAKRFGGENSGRFINGVLRTILEEHPRADGSPRRIRTARFSEITRVVGLQGTVYHRGGQVRTAEGAPNRGFRW